MAANTKKRIHISMDLSKRGDKWRHDTVAGIVQLAPTSPLIANPSIQVSVTELTALSATLKAANDTVAAERTKLAAAVEEETNARSAVDAELLTLKSAVENKSAKTSDVTSMGFEERGGPPPKSPVVPPETIDIRLPNKLRGQFTASARELGKTKWRYVAQQSPDPIGENTWVTVPGYSKMRVVTAPSGAMVWVRFARVRGQIQSDWSTPVLVTVP